MTGPKLCCAQFEGAFRLVPHVHGEVMASSKPPHTPSDVKAGQSVNSNRDVELEQRRQALNDALARQGPENGLQASDGQSGASSGFGAALKMSSEFIAGILVGAGLGYLLDLLAGTTPWGLIVFLFLGFAAGVLNVLRAAGRVAEPAAGARGERLRGDDADDAL